MSSNVKFLFLSLVVVFSSCGKSRKELAAAVPPSGGGSVIDLTPKENLCPNIAAFDDIKNRPLQFKSEIPVGVYKLKEMNLHIYDPELEFSLQATAKESTRFHAKIDCHSYLLMMKRSSHNSKMDIRTSTQIDLRTKRTMSEQRLLEVKIRNGDVEFANTKLVKMDKSSQNNLKSEKLFLEKYESGRDFLVSMRTYLIAKNEFVLIIKFEYPAENGKRVVQFNRSIYQRVK